MILGTTTFNPMPLIIFIVKLVFKLCLSWVGREGLVVYKQGSSTDLTMGRLVKIEDVPPKGWYVVDDDSDKDEESKYIVFERESGDNDVGDEQKDKDSNEWLGIVKLVRRVSIHRPEGFGEFSVCEGGKCHGPPRNTRWMPGIGPQS